MKRYSCWFLIVMLTSHLRAGIPEPKGTWEFNTPDTTGATVGAPLEIVGFAQIVPGVNAQDGAISIGEGSYYVCSHGISPNGGGAKVNEWTLLIDFSYPLSSLSDPPNGYNDLFQTDPTNTDDADWTINSSGAIGIGAVGYSGAFGYTTGPNTWYRMVVVVDNGVRHDLYVDGVEILKGRIPYYELGQILLCGRHSRLFSKASSLTAAEALRNPRSSMGFMRRSTI